jgi:hypothetical protein
MLHIFHYNRHNFFHILEEVTSLLLALLPEVPPLLHASIWFSVPGQPFRMHVSYSSVEELFAV